jgi:uncharacterized membrane protein
MKKPVLENLVDVSQRWNLKLEFSLENLIQVKKILFRENISMKEFFSFLSYMVEHNEKYKDIYETIIKEIKLLKTNNSLPVLDTLNKNKKNIYTILDSSDAFKNRKDYYNSDEEKNFGEENKNSEENHFEQNSYQKYIEVISKYGSKKDTE